MDSISSFQERLEMLHAQKMKQVTAWEAISDAFSQQAELSLRQDKVRAIDALKTRLENQIMYVMTQEDTASSKRQDANYLLSIMKFGFGAWEGLRSNRHPLLVGAKSGLKQLAETEPFGTIMIAVGPGGIPSDVHLVNVSKEARREGISESQVIVRLTQGGDQLFVPEAFFEDIEQLKVSILHPIKWRPVDKARQEQTTVPSVTTESPKLVQEVDASKNQSS